MCIIYYVIFLQTVDLIRDCHYNTWLKKNSKHRHGHAETYFNSLTTTELKFGNCQNECLTPKGRSDWIFI